MALENTVQYFGIIRLMLPGYSRQLVQLVIAISPLPKKNCKNRTNNGLAWNMS